MGIGNSTGQQSTVRAQPKWTTFCGPYSSKHYKRTVQFRKRKVMFILVAQRSRAWCTCLDIAELTFLKRTYSHILYSEEPKRDTPAVEISTIGVYRIPNLGVLQAAQEIIVIGGALFAKIVRWKQSAFPEIRLGMCAWTDFLTPPAKRRKWHEMKYDLSFLSTSLLPPDMLGGLFVSFVASCCPFS